MKTAIEKIYEKRDEREKRLRRLLLSLGINYRKDEMSYRSVGTLSPGDRIEVKTRQLLERFAEDGMVLCAIRVCHKAGRLHLILFIDGQMGRDQITFAWYRKNWVLLDFQL